MWLEGVQNHCLFIFLSTIESIISLLEIESNESNIDPKLISQHSPVTEDSFGYFGCVFWKSRTQGKYETKFFLISENQRPCGWKEFKITVFASFFSPLKVLFPCLKLSQMSSILIQNLSDNTLLSLEIVLDILDVRFGSLERKVNTK